MSSPTSPSSSATPSCPSASATTRSSTRCAQRPATPVPIAHCSLVLTPVPLRLAGPSTSPTPVRAPLAPRPSPRCHKQRASPPRHAAAHSARPAFVWCRLRPEHQCERAARTHRPCRRRTADTTDSAPPLPFAEIRETLNNLILKAPQEWHTQVALPFVKIVGTSVEWDEIKFDVRLLQRVPVRSCHRRVHCRAPLTPPRPPLCVRSTRASRA